MKTTVIFDWNGTLMDDVQYSVDLENDMFEKRGIAPITVETYRDIFCFPVIEYYKRMGMTFENEPFEVMSAEFMDRYLKNYRDCPLVKNSKEVLTALKDRGIHLVILSASKQDYLEEQVEFYGLTSFFDEVIGIDNIHAASKIQRAKDWMDSVNLDCSSCIMIGDSAHDSAVCDELGIDCVLISTGHESKDRLAKTGRNVIDDHLELLNYVK